jgi:cysteine desulfurase
LAETEREIPTRLETFLEPLDSLVASHPSLVSRTPHGTHLPGLRSFTVQDARGEVMVYLLDQAGLACSTGSACTAGVAQPSHVLEAMGLGDKAASSAVRVSLGYGSTARDVEALVAALPEAVERAQAAARIKVDGE